MAHGDFMSNFHLLIRWLHVFAGIVWIGHLYFFNFVNIPLQAAIDDDTRKAVNKKMMLRALWWFRWGAMVTFLAGLLLFVINYMYTPGVGFGPSALFMDEAGLTQRSVWILAGMLFGTIMWFNVWFIIWPAQKGIFGGKITGDAVAPTKARASKASRMNTYLSGPMLYGMLGAAHYTSINAATLVVFIVLGLLPIWLSYNASGNVGKDV